MWTVRCEVMQMVRSARRGENSEKVISKVAFALRKKKHVYFVTYVKNVSCKVCSTYQVQKSVCKQFVCSKRLCQLDFLWQDILCLSHRVCSLWGRKLRVHYRTVLLHRTLSNIELPSTVHVKNRSRNNNLLSHFHLSVKLVCRLKWKK